VHADVAETQPPSGSCEPDRAGACRMSSRGFGMGIGEPDAAATAGAGPVFYDFQPRTHDSTQAGRHADNFFAAHACTTPVELNIVAIAASMLHKEGILDSVVPRRPQRTGSTASLATSYPPITRAHAESAQQPELTNTG
jgi:hypothetical protein